MNCSNCSLKDNLMVKGQIGTINSIVLIGEAPGYMETVKGKPFCGKAGEELRKTIKELGIDFESLYVSNAVLCRPVNSDDINRTPTENEILNCNGRLIESIKNINPKVVIALGKVAYFALVNRDNKLSNIIMSNVVGKFYPTEFGFLVFSTYHPAFLLRNNKFRIIFRNHLVEAFRKAEVIK